VTTTNKIRETRELRGMSQGELARRIGATASTVSRLESGARRLSQMYMDSIGKALGVEPGSLISGGVGRVDDTSLVQVAGTCSDKTWSVPTHSAADGRIPVLLPSEYRKLTGTAYLMADDHAAEYGIPKDAHAITVQLSAARRAPLDGDLIMVRTKEGRMERQCITKAYNDSRGSIVTIDGEEIILGSESIAVGLVVSVYREF